MLTLTGAKLLVIVKISCCYRFYVLKYGVIVMREFILSERDGNVVVDWALL